MNPRLRYPLLSGALFCLSSTFSLPALSATDAMVDLLKVLRDKGTISDSDYNALEKAAKSDKAQIKKAVSDATKDTVKVKTGHAGLKVQSGDGAFKFQLGGRLMVDAAFYDKDKTQLGNGAELRRARLFVKGTAYKDWFYKGQLDFAGSKVSVKDFYMGYHGFKPVKIVIGHHKEPFSLEEQTSSKYITFMERGLTSTFSPGRNTGISVASHGQQWGARVGYFFDGVKNNASPNGQGWGLTGRVHFAPINEKDRVIHLGAAASYRGSDSSNNKLRFRERAETHITSTRLVDTGDINNYDNETRYGLEAAAVLGPFSVQSEYMRTSVDTRGPGSDPEFSGWYAYGSYFLTGEHRPYKASSGSFGRVKPASVVGQGGTGAWELAARYSSLDLKDSGINGGRENDITVGLNWYATPNVRFMANYVRASTDPTSVVKFPTTGNEDVNIFQLRSQIDF